MDVRRTIGAMLERLGWIRPEGRRDGTRSEAAGASRRDPFASSEAPEDVEPPVVDLPIGDEIDLHAFDPREIRDLVDTYLHEARRLGYDEVRVVHGKGKGVQRRIVHALLDGHPAVRSYRLADHTRGGWGATLVRLRAHAADTPTDESSDADGG